MYTISLGGYRRNWFTVVAYRKGFRMGNRKNSETYFHYILLKTLYYVHAFTIQINKLLNNTHKIHGYVRKCPYLLKIQT